MLTNIILYVEYNGGAIIGVVLLVITLISVFNYGILPGLKSGTTRRYKTFLHSFDKATTTKNVGEIKSGDYILVDRGHAFVSMDDTIWLYYLIKIRSAELTNKGINLDRETIGVLNALRSSNLMNIIERPGFFKKPRFFTGERELLIRTMQPIEKIPQGKIDAFGKDGVYLYTDLSEEMTILTIPIEDLLNSFEKKEEILSETTTT